jgi:hypothetical protein
MVALSLCAAGAAEALQQAPASTNPVAGFIEEDQARQTTDADDSTAEAVPELPDLASLDALDPDTREAAIASIRAYYRYRESGFEHRRAVFDWQLQSSRIIFWVVILMVGTGIYFSGVQFHAALRSYPVRPRARASRAGQTTSRETSRTQASAPATAAATSRHEPATTDDVEPVGVGVSLQTSIEAGSAGVKLSSPVLGIVILVISFLFFYLYLVHVYPISEIW